MKHLPWVKVGHFLYNYPGNKFTLSVPRGTATHYRELFGEMKWNRTEKSVVISWLSYN